MLITASTRKKREYPLISSEECLAKTRGNDKGCNIATHLRVTCKIFQQLRKIWAGQVKGDYFFSEAEWLAAYHDIGKMTPAFQQKIYSALNLPLPWGTRLEENSRGGHARNSMIILEKECGKALAKIAGAHHGLPLEFTLGNNLNCEELGGDDWQRQREELMQQLNAELNLPNEFSKEKAKEFRDIILGSIILSDWLSSSMDIAYGDEPTEEEIRQVIQNAGLIPQTVKEGLGFSQIFGFAENSLQKTILSQVVPGGIFVVESSMGSGKTEAALGIAYSLLEQKKADGIYFALPTRLTSEKIYERLNTFLDNVLEINNKAILIHGDSWLQWDIQEPSESSRERPQKDSWFQSKKRALLASFGAGTLDQALLAVLPRVKHNALRAFALTGKVIIMDEIHSYDAYTANLLQTFIGQLRKWGCTVILLSATLTQKACCAFAHCPEEQLTDTSYPRILVNDNDKLTVIPIGSEKSVEVKLRHEFNENAVISEVIERAKSGEQVLWIENTVAEVQRIYRIFKVNTTGIEVGIIHSRFPGDYRKKNEGYWADLLGKNGGEARQKCGRILVASQVLEQSVDVDADFMVSRLAPVDFVFQRIGRLWRHERKRPDSALRQAVLLIPPELEDPEQVVKHQEKFRPYDPYWLYRSAEALKDKVSLSLPEDIRPVLEAVYADREEEGALAKLKQNMLAQKEKLEMSARGAKGDAGHIMDDDKFGTRASDDEQVQVLLLKKGSLRDPQFLHPVCSEPIRLCDATASKGERLTVTKQLLGLMIKVREYYAPTADDFSPDFLQEYLWVGHDDSCRPIRVAYVDDTGQLLDCACNPVKNGVLYFTKEIGYEIRT